MRKMIALLTAAIAKHDTTKVARKRLTCNFMFIKTVEKIIFQACDVNELYL